MEREGKEGKGSYDVEVYGRVMMGKEDRFGYDGRVWYGSEGLGMGRLG